MKARQLLVAGLGFLLPGCGNETRGLDEIKPADGATKDVRARAVLKSIRQAYAALDTYADDAQMHSADGRDFKFRVRMKRPYQLLYDYESSSTWYPGYHAIWTVGERKVQHFSGVDSSYSANTLRAVHWYERGSKRGFLSFAGPSSLNMCVGSMRGVTQGTSTDLPSLLFPYDISSNFWFFDTEDVTADLQQFERGVLCDVLYSPSLKLRGWFDAKTHLLRKTIDWRINPQTITYNPRPNASVKGEELSLLPKVIGDEQNSSPSANVTNAASSRLDR